MNPNPENTRIEVKTTEIVAENAPVVTRRKPILAPRGRRGMLDVPEIVALSVAGLMLLGVVFAYLFLLRPEYDKVNQRKTASRDMEKQLADLKTKIDENQTTESQVQELVASVERFEANYLKPTGGQGNSALYARLNELIRANSLRNTAGPEYAPLEIMDAAKFGKEDQQKGRSKLQSLYPGTGVSVTVEGSYQNLRRFISQLEQSPQFIVVNAMEIESTGETLVTSNLNEPAPARNQGSIPLTGAPSSATGIPDPKVKPNTVNPRAPQMIQTPPPDGAPAPVRSRSNVISMRLELATYFRPSLSAAPPSVSNN